MTDLRGKVALVTGGNGGIGLGMAEGLAKAGCDLVIWGSNPDKNAAAEKILKAHDVRVLAQRCDVANEAQVEDSFAAALAVMGRVDGCFANAGVSQKHGPFHAAGSRPT
jgi:NAD(P)-dependent dehydrogenase (short-subunit alcohol dehydrogenase family)